MTKNSAQRAPANWASCHPSQKVYVLFCIYFKNVLYSYPITRGEGKDLEDKKTTLSYRIIRWLVRLFTPRMEPVGFERLPEEPCVLVGNHCQMFGPVAGELYVPGRHYIWCAGEMMNRGEVAAYAFKDFWSFKPRFLHPFYRLLSVLITPLSLCLFNNAHTIPVYRDTRIITTFRQSMQRLDEGNSLVIFPEHNQKHNNIIYDFQDKYIDLARFYYKRSGKALCFVPLYIAPRLGKMVVGEPIRFDPAAPIAEERERICKLLMERVTMLGVELPPHTVIPYRNIRKRDYPKNRPLEVYDHETAGR